MNAARGCAGAAAALLSWGSAAGGQTTVELDVPYVSGAHPKQHLDLYLPSGSGFATVLFIHGGSLSSGDRKDEPAADLCARFNERGMGCAATSYRLFPDVDWPVPAEDAAAAVAWLTEALPARGGAAGELFLLGHSSGCLLASLVGADRRYLAAYGLEPDAIAGIVALGCRLDNQPADTAGVDPARIARYFAPGGPGERYRSYQALFESVPMNHVGRHLPPFLVLLAEEERFKPPILEDGAAFVGLAKDCEVDADIRVLPDRGHRTALQRMAEPRDPGFGAVAGFVERLVSEGPRVHLADESRCPR